ncbi:MAG: ABC transporter permease subunit [Methanomassiliicoccales archaeon]
MRLEKILTVARKDLAEFRTNKYILFSLIAMPLVMAVVMPVVYLVPVTMFAGPNEQEPLNLKFNISITVIGGNISELSLKDLRLVGANLTNSVLISCVLEECNISGSVIRDSWIINSTTSESLVFHSNLKNTLRINSVLDRCVVIGEVSEAESFLRVFIDSLLMFFILIPSVIPTVIASYSFVGEKINKSLEPLLATPTTDTELLAGKCVSIFIPTMVVTWISLVPFIVLVDTIVFPVIGYYPLPNLVWIIGVFVLAPLFCILSILVNMLISSKVSDVRASQQIGGLVVLPVVAFFIIAITGLVTLDLLFMLSFVLLTAVIDAVVFYISLKVFRREEILVSWK